MHVEFRGGRKTLKTRDQSAGGRGCKPEMHGQKIPRADDLLKQRRGPAHPFLGRLKEQPHIALDHIRRPPQKSGCSQAESRMPVVAAGVTETGMAGCEAFPRRAMLRPLGFRYFQSVQIKAQHKIRLLAGMQIRHNAGGHAHAFQPVRGGAFAAARVRARLSTEGDGRPRRSVGSRISLPTRGA